MQSLFDFLRPLFDPAVLRELCVVLPLLGLSALVARRLRKSAALEGRALHGEGLRRLAFPLLSVLLLMLGRFATHHLGWSGRTIGLAVQLALAMAGVRMAVFALRQTFSSSSLLAGFERTVAMLIWTFVALDVIGVLPEFVEWLDGFKLHVGKSGITLWQILQGTVTVIVSALIAMWLGGVADTRLQAAQELDISLRVVLARLIKALLLFVAVLLGMSLAGLDITTLSVFGGALGVGLGLGMQKIASNYVAGFIILLERSINIGNVIQVGADQRGEVLRITTRYTVLKGQGSTHYLVPNENLVSSVVQNDSYVDRTVRLTTRIQVAYDCDIDLAMRLLAEAPIGIEGLIDVPPPEALLKSFDDSGISLELVYTIVRDGSSAQKIQSDVNLAILRKLRAAGIEIPYPHRVVHLADTGNMPGSPA
ncbi:MAG: mechanosensitive ion channel [Rhodocyclaceae bacterium]